MSKPPSYVDVTALAGEAGYSLRWEQLAFHREYEARGVVPIYLTRPLAEALGGPDPAGLRAGALKLLRAVHALVHDRIVNGTSWRTQLIYPVPGGTGALWVVLGNRYSDGLAFGLGRGDFW